MLTRPISRIRAAIAFASLVAGLFIVATPTSAGAVGETSGGVFVPVAPSDIVDTESGVGGSSSPFGSESTRSYTVLGKAGVPTSGVSSVALNVRVFHATSDSANSHLVVWPTGETKPGAKTMYFEEDNSARSNTTIVKVGSGGMISVYNHSGTVDIGVSVTGYFTSTSDETSAGGFVPITPTTVADTGTGLGVPLAPLPKGSTIEVQVSNDEDIPADASAVFANVEVRSEGRSGLKIVPAGSSLSNVLPTVKYQDEGPTSSGVILRLSSSGKIAINNPNSTYGDDVDFKIDIQGYFSGQSDEGGSFTPLTAQTVYSSTSTGNTSLGAGETRLLPVAGEAGIPNDGTAGAAALSLTVRNWTASGALTAFNADDEESSTTNLSFLVGEGEPANGSTVTAIVRLSEDGQIKVHNSSSAAVTFYVSAQGWFSQEPYVDDVAVLGSDIEDYSPPFQTVSDPTESALTFAPQIPSSASLLSDQVGSVEMTDANGSVVGHFEPVVVDDLGNEIPATMSVAGRSIDLDVNPPVETAYPIVAGVMYVANEERPELDGDVQGEVVVDDVTAAIIEDSAEGSFTTLSSKPYVRVPSNYIYRGGKGPNPRLHDYCSKSPDGYMKASFKGPCARHDMCIEKRWYNGDRPRCDRNLSNDMRINCRYAYGKFNPTRYECYSIAGVYYSVVRAKTFFS